MIGINISVTLSVPMVLLRTLGSVDFCKTASWMIRSIMTKLFVNVLLNVCRRMYIAFMRFEVTASLPRNPLLAGCGSLRGVGWNLSAWAFR